MIFTVERANVAQIEVVIRCPDPDAPAVVQLCEQLKEPQVPIHAYERGDMHIVAPQDVLYAEFVNRHVFVYTQSDVFPASLSLAQMQTQHPAFFRCSKGMLLNLQHVKRLKSETCGRILATLSNGENIVVSRHYAAHLRKKLQGGV